MSSPLSSLKRYSKLPLPGHIRNIKISTSPGERETKALLEEVSNSMLISLFMSQDKPRRSLPNVDTPTSFAGSRLPNISDRELVSLLMTRLTNVETRLNVQKEELIEKDKRILQLEKKIRLLDIQNGKSPEETVDTLTQHCESLQNQIREMEDFLYDYGLVWVGGSKDKERKQEDTKDATGVNDTSMWCPEESVEQAQTKLNFDVIIENIKELNLLAGEGVTKVEQTKDGARLKYTESATLTLYRNGIFLLNGPFRPFTDPATRRCLYDIMEGFFPSELQSTYPEGIPLKVTDQRNIDYTSDPTNAFPGPGQILNSLDRDIPDVSPQTSSSNIFSSETRCIAQNMTQPHEPRLTTDQFLKKVPINIIKNGKVIEVRKSLENILKSTSPPKHRQLTIIETMVEKEKHMRSECAVNAPSSCNIANIQVKSETGDCTYLLKMNYLDTIGDLRRYLDTHRPTASLPYQILSTFPRRVLNDLDETIEDCGLIPTATLVLESIT